MSRDAFAWLDEPEMIERLKRMAPNQAVYMLRVRGVPEQRIAALRDLIGTEHEGKRHWILTLRYLGLSTYQIGRIVGMSHTAVNRYCTKVKPRVRRRLDPRRVADLYAVYMSEKLYKASPSAAANKLLEYTDAPVFSR